MSFRGTIEPWIVEALQHHNGQANITAIAKYIWEHRRAEIELNGNALYTWQYDMRWAGQSLQKKGVLKKYRTYWRLTK